MKNKMSWNEIKRTIGGMSFAVSVILLLTIAMIAGTFIESYYGSDFASRLIYKSPLFMFMEFAMFLSIIFAAFLRIPSKKRLHGFYIIHAGLVLIGVGALVTYVTGVDGYLTLNPNEPNRQVVLARDVLKISYPDEGREVSTFLPYSAFETNLDQTYDLITLKKYLPFAEQSSPATPPVAIVPIQQDGSLIKGDLRAVEIEYAGKSYWVSNYNPLSLVVQGKNVVLEVTKETLMLPFEMVLTEFKMDKAPGTSMPASYESFVKLLSGSEVSNHHIFMNNPLKFQGYTFYQASYAQNENGTYSSTLSVNVDSGRPLKYLGSLMLVIGAIWHFGVSKKTKGSSV